MRKSLAKLGDIACRKTVYSKVTKAGEHTLEAEFASEKQRFLLDLKTFQSSFQDAN